MTRPTPWSILSLAAVSFVLSFVGTWLMKRLAPRLGFVDKPGHRKIHRAPVPLGGGVAIVLAFALPLLAVLAFCNFVTVIPSQTGLSPYVTGVLRQTDLALAVLAATAVLHVMGLVDDRKALGPYSKLVVQLAVAAALVVSFKSLRILTAFGTVSSVVLTVLWITAITNAFNFLDNMDGLSAGVAAVCTAAFLAAALSIGQWFVAGSLAMLLG